MIKYPNIIVNIRDAKGEDWNYVLGQVQRALRAAGHLTPEIATFHVEATRGEEYAHLLKTAREWVTLIE